MSQDLAKTGKKLNNRKSGAKAAAKARRRTEAEARAAAYAKKSVAEKLKTAGAKERKKLLGKVEKQILAGAKLENL